MKTFVAVALLAAIVSAQSTSDLPACALACAAGAVGASGGCTVTDTACLCKSSGYLSSFSTCLASTCSPADQQTAATVGNALCAQAGVTLSSSAAPTSTATNSAESSSASASASSALSSISSSVSASASSASASASSMASSMSSAMSSSMASMSSSMSSASHSSASSMSASASSASASAASSSGAAAPTQAFAWELVGLGAAAAAALL